MYKIVVGLCFLLSLFVWSFPNIWLIISGRFCISGVCKCSDKDLTPVAAEAEK